MFQNRIKVFRCFLFSIVLVGTFYAGWLTAPKKAPGTQGDATGPKREFAQRSEPKSATAPGELPAISQSDIQAASRQIGSRPASRQQMDRLLEVLLAWAKSDPRAAADYAKRELKPPFLDEALTKLLSFWSQNHPEAAWTWATTEMADNFVPIDAVLSEVGKSLPKRAWDFATDFALKRPQDASGAYVAAMKGMMHAGQYDALIRLIDGAVLPPDAATSDYGLHDLLASNWARYDPQKTKEWVHTLNPDTREYRHAVTGLGDSWAVKDPEGAANFALQLSPTPERQRILRASADEWAIANPDRAAEWLTRYKGHANYDSLVAAVATAERNMDSNVAQTLSWASQIADGDLRLNSQSRIMERWATRDPEAARQFLINSYTLPLADRQAIHQRLKSAGSLAK